MDASSSALRRSCTASVRSERGALSRPRPRQVASHRPESARTAGASWADANTGSGPNRDHSRIMIPVILPTPKGRFRWGPGWSLSCPRPQPLVSGIKVVSNQYHDIKLDPKGKKTGWDSCPMSPKPGPPLEAPTGLRNVTLFKSLLCYIDPSMAEGPAGVRAIFS